MLAVLRPLGSGPQLEQNAADLPELAVLHAAVSAGTDSVAENSAAVVAEAGNSVVVGSFELAAGAGTDQTVSGIVVADQTAAVLVVVELVGTVVSVAVAAFSLGQS